jgi:hypothetical protein
MARAQTRTESNESPVENPDIDFGLIPKALLAKCRRLIEAYHDVHGYESLPDILWHPVRRDFIETHYPFGPIFKRACRARSAKRANDTFVMIASTLLSLEVLASDFESWSAKYPAAKQLANAIWKDYSLDSRRHLVERYVFPRSYINRTFIDVFSSSDTN